MTFGRSTRFKAERRPSSMPDDERRRLLSDRDRRRYLSFIRSHHCSFWVRGNPGGCEGRTEAHHLLDPEVGERGMGMKSSDENAVPLCMKHHRELHAERGSEAAMLEAYGFPPDELKKLAGKCLAMFLRGRE